MSYSKKHIAQNEVHEPMAAYITTDSVTSFYHLLTGINPAKASSEFDVTTLAQKISLTLQELAGIMHMSERTLQRYEDDAVLKTEYAEKAVELARLYTRGQEVFGSMDKFKLWMKTPGHVFKGDTPVSLLDTSIGFDLVLRELGRIEHGVFA
jgi:putative toxin-antitoxin system antitoxin component (TIGR02293 family)